MYTIEVCNRRLASRPLETPKMIPSMIQLCCKNLPPRLFGTSPSSCCSLSCCWTEVHANNTQKTGWPQSSTDFPTTVKLLLCCCSHWFSFKDFGPVQQFNKSSLLERDANYWKSLCLSNFYETKILYIIQLTKVKRFNILLVHPVVFYAVWGLKLGWYRATWQQDWSLQSPSLRCCYEEAEESSQKLLQYISSSFNV